MLKGNFEKLHLLRYYISHFTLSGVLFHCICAFEKRRIYGVIRASYYTGHEKTLSLVFNRCPCDYDTQIYETIANSLKEKAGRGTTCPFACECLKRYIIISLLVKYHRLFNICGMKSTINPTLIS